MRNFIDIAEILTEAWNPALTAKNYGEKLKAKMLLDSSLRAVGLLKGAVHPGSGRAQIQGAPIEIFNNGGPNNRAYSYAPMSNEEIIEFFSQFDPTKKKFYLLNWIIPMYLSGGISRLEDLSGVKQDLAKFHELKHLMSIQNIKQITSATNLSQIVREATSSLQEGGIFVPKEEAEAAKKESILVAENDEYCIVIPLTERAAGYWGRYSEWCTAYGYEYGINSSKTSYFNTYDGDGQHLLIFFDKKATFDEDGNPDEDASVQCFYGSEKQIADSEDHNCSGSIDDIVKMIPEDRRALVVENCLREFKYENSELLQRYKNLQEIIDEFGNDKIKFYANIVLGGDHQEWTNGYSSLDDCINYMPSNVRKLLDAYVEQKYPEESEDNNMSTEEILSGHEDDEEEVIDMIKRADDDARTLGAESEMYEYFESALKSAGIEYENIDQSPIYIKHSFVDYLNNPTDNGTKIEMSEPYYGFSGYDESAYEDSELMPFLKKALLSNAGVST